MDNKLNLIPGMILDVDLSEQSIEAIKDYTEAVEERTVPAVEDGLKPAQRRVLFSTYQLGAGFNSAHKKCARVVGDTIGKYHPHGDSSTYIALVNMAVPEKINVPLIDKHGNFGNTDDGPAAMRYTECRLSEYAEKALMKDLSPHVVPFIPNFDDTEEEPTVLPASLPNILINQNTSIGMGAAGSLLPHNPIAVTDMVIAYVKDRNIVDEDLINILQAPDFPSRGVINGTAGIHKAYREGVGSCVLRGEWHLETEKNGREILVIDSIPYNVPMTESNSSSGVCVAIERLMSSGDLSLRFLRNETGKGNPCRITLGLKKDEDHQRVVNLLYQSAKLEQRYKMIHNVSVKGKAYYEVSLRFIVEEFVKFREETLFNKFKYELSRCEDRLHLLEGILIIAKNPMEAVQIIEKSKNKEDAINNLIKAYKLSSRQATYIVEMKLYQITNMEIKSVKEEEAKLKKRVVELKKLTSSSSNKYLDEVMLNEWEYLKKTLFKDYQRKTKVENKYNKIDTSATVRTEPCVLIITKLGYLKRMPSLQKVQNRGGTGMNLSGMRNDDVVQYVLDTTTTSNIYAITNRGRIYTFQPYIIDESTRDSKGKLDRNVFRLNDNEKILQYVENNSNGDVIITVSERGLVKVTDIKEVINVNAAGKKLCTIDTHDKLIAIFTASHKKDDILISTTDGQSIRFDLSGIRKTGTGARGVGGITLKNKDKVVASCPVSDTSALLFISSNGYIKKVSGKDLPCKGRNGYGVITVPKSADYGELVGVVPMTTETISVITKLGKVLTMNVSTMGTLSRGSKGVKAISLSPDDCVYMIA